MEVMDISIKAAKENNITVINAINLVIGKNSCINESEMQFYFDIAKKDTIAEKAVLNIMRDENIEGCGSEYIKSIEGD